MALPEKFSVALPVEIVASGGVPVRQVDTNGVSLDDATDGYGVAMPVMPVNSSGANENASLIFSTWKRVTLSADGIPVIRVDVNGNSVNTALGNISTPPANLTIPVITGTLNQGDTLSTSNGTWSNTPTSYTYQWKADGSPISGAVAATYDLTAAEVTKMITVTVTATNADGSASATSAAVGPVTAVLPTPSPVLTKTSATGTNPMDWQGSYDGLILGRDTVRMEWRVNAGAWNQDTDHLVTSNDLLLGSWAWPLFDATTFTAGQVVEVRERLVRDAGAPGETLSAWSNIITDTMAAVAFAPSQLYGVGDVGYAWNTTDATKVWQSNDGTIAGAFTSPVGRVTDISGLNNHVNSENNTTFRPVWQNVANGMMKFDGSDDKMAVTPCLWAGGAGTVVLAVKGPSQDGVFFMGEASSTSSQPVWAPGLRSNINQDVLFYHRNDAGGATATNKDINVFNDVTNVLAIVDNGSTVSFYVNGSVTPAATHNYTSRATLGATTGIDRAYLGNVRVAGTDYDVSTSAYIGSGIVIDRALNGTELADAVAWVANLHGVTIP